MKYILTIIVVVILTVDISYAQQLKGILISESTQKPIQDATVAINAIDSTTIASTITNAEGKFQLPMQKGSYMIYCSALGYYSYSMVINPNTSKDLDLKYITLIEDTLSTTLEEVYVQGINKTQTVSGSTYFPTQDQLKASPNSLVLLTNMHIPRLLVNDKEGTLSIQGTDNVVYKINGVTSTLNDLKAIDPKQILRIEYNDAPSIRYTDSNSGLINVILKERESGMSLFANGTTAFTAGFVNGNTTLARYYKKSMFSINYNVQWRKYKKWRLDQEETFQTNDGELYRDQHGLNSHFRYLIQNVNLTYQYSRENDLLSVKFNNSFGSQKNSIKSSITQSFDYMDYNRISKNKFESYSPSLDISYLRKMDAKKELEFNLVGTYMNTDDKRNLKDWTGENILDEVNNLVDGDRFSVIGEAMFSNKTDHFNYSFGLRSMYAYSKNNYKLQGDLVKLQNIEQYPFFQIQGQFKKVSYNVGLGLKYIYTDNKEDNFHFYRALFSTRLRYKIDEYWNLYLYSQLRPNFPNLSDFSDIEQQVDNMYMMTSNSSITPYYNFNNSLNLTYSKGIFNAEVLVKNYRWIKPIRQYIYLDSDLNKFYIQNINQKYDNNFGVDVELSLLSLFNFLSVGVNSAWNRYDTKGKFYSNTENYFSIGASANATYKDFSIYGGWSNTNKSLYGEIITNSVPRSYIGLSYGKNNFSIYGLFDRLFLHGPQYTTDQTTKAVSINRSIYIKENDSMFTLGFSYSFNSGKKNKGANKRLNNRDYDNSIMKVSE